MAKTQLFFLPSPGIGHVISTIELAKCLLSRGSFSITVFLMHLAAIDSTIKSYMNYVRSSGIDILFEELPHIQPPHRPNQKSFTFLSSLMEAQKPYLKDAITRHLCQPLSAPISALILDMFSTSMIDVANELSILPYIYFTSNAANLGAMLYLPTLHVNLPYEMKDIRGYINLPGFPPVLPHIMPEPMMDKTDEAYMILIRQCQRFREVKGIIINTFDELEHKQLKALADGKCLPEHPTPLVYPVGPLLSTGCHCAHTRQHKCMDWLDRQPLASVVFLCFGSMGTFPPTQLKEIAVGLEQSGHRFLWTLHSIDGLQTSSIEADLNHILPDRFLERTKFRGMVWPSWAPQVEILSHKAVGGFVTHCGWNSILESLWFGVPMLGWPLYAEQHLNCLQMVKDLGVALDLKLDHGNKGFVCSEELEKGVRLLMGDSEDMMKLKAKVEVMKMAGRKAVEKGGSSDDALQCFLGELAKN